MTSSATAPSPRVGGPLTGVRSHAWVRFGVRRFGRLLVSLWVLETASFLIALAAICLMGFAI